MNAFWIAVSAFGVGLVSFGHCLGMCGGISILLGMGVSNQRTRFFYLFCYNLGRIVTYTTVVLVLVTLGKHWSIFHLNPLYARVLTSIFLLATGLYLCGLPQLLYPLERFGEKLWQRIRPLGQKLLPVKTLSRAFLLGLLWGFLPCGLVYAQWGTALTLSDPSKSVLWMLFFGLGTMPVLLLSSYASRLQHYMKWRRLLGVFVIILALAPLSHIISHHNTGLGSTLLPESHQQSQHQH
jgi:sulfite exporter TauE/SafE